MGTVDQEKLKKLEAVKLSLEKDFGKGIVSKLNSGAIEGVEFLPTSIMEFDELSGGGFPRGRIIEIYGPESCLAFDTKIPYASLKENGKVQNHKGGTIENLYYRFHNIKRKGIGNYIRRQSTESKYYVASINEENKIFRNEIADVVKTGVKECFLLKTEKRTIEATKDHKFFNGEEYIALEKLNKGDTVYVHNNIPFRKEHKKIKYKEVMIKYHPTGRKKTVEGKYNYYRLHNSHFVYEANENNMSIEEYRNYLNNESKEKINKLWTVPKNMDIHHKDANSLNDSLDNLLLIDKSEHYRLHATENHNNMRFVVVPEKIISIKSVGEKETYDIKCFSPYNNFIANGFVVHNSGKTTLALHAIESAQRAGGVCAFVDMEHSLDPVYAQNLGVDIDNLWVSQPESGEQGLEVTEQMVTSGVVDVVVFDSVAAAIPQKELDGEYGDSNMGLQARLMSQAMRKLTGTISKTNCIVIFINQIRCIDVNTLCIIDNKLSLFDKVDENKFIGSKKILNVFNSGNIEGLTIASKYRPPFNISYNHKQPCITSEGEYCIKPARELTCHDWLISPEQNIEFNRNINYINLESMIKNIENNLYYYNTKKVILPTVLDEDLAFILGTYYSDGSIRDYKNKCDYGVQWTENNKERFLLIKESLNKLFPETNSKKFKSKALYLNGKVYKDFFEALGMKRYGRNKEIPQIIIDSPFSVIRSFIRGCFFDTHKFSSQGFIFTNENKNSLNQFATILYYCGIFADIRKNYLYVTGKDAIRFNETFGFSEKTKIKKASNFKSYYNSRGKADIVPHAYGKKLIEKAKAETKVKITNFYKYSNLNMCFHKKLNFDRNTLLNFLNYCEYFTEEVTFIKENRFSKINLIEKSTFSAKDIEVDGSLFVAGAYLTHNCKIGLVFGNPETTCVTPDTMIEIE
jgi:RecA/RadA recombinase